MNARLTTPPPSVVPRGLLLALIMSNLLSPSAAAEPKIWSPEDPNARGAVVLSQRELTESSGLAASNRQPGLFWSHNDSGGKAELFAFDQTGKFAGLCRLSGAKAIDWEDMASFVADGNAQLIVADCGDNQANRETISLYLLDEPDPRETTDVSAYRELVVSYPDGARDCEAIAVDPLRKQIILISKTTLSTAGIYTLPLSVASPTRRETTRLTAKRVGGLLLPMISAMDLDHASGDVWIINYFRAYRFSCTDRSQSLGEQLGALPKPFDLPRWKQIEALAVDANHQVWLTSEGTPTPLGRLRISDAP